MKLQKRVIAIVLDGFEETELIAPVDMLRRAGIDVDVATVGKTTAISSHNFSLSNLIDINTIDPKSYDLLILPGGAHYKKVIKCDMYLKLIEYYAKNKIVGAICAGPTILGKLGLLKGKNYTCFTAMNEDFGGNYKYQYVVEDGNIITAQACGASIEFGLKLVEYLLGTNAKIDIMKRIYY